MRSNRLALLLLLSFPAIDVLLPAPAHAEAVGTRNRDVEVLLRSVRRAVGYDAVRRIRTGFALREQQEGSSGPARTIWFGTRRGELRQGDEYGYDGLRRWRLDDRRGMAIPVSLRAHEKQAWPLWVRGYWWLNPGSGFTIRIIADASDARQVTIGLQEPEGLIEARLTIDRATSLPRRLVVPYERGPYSVDYSDYRMTPLGFRWAFAAATSYRDQALLRTEAVEALPASARFAAPPRPNDAAFDAARPAAVEARLGPDFAGGLPGHSFVRVRLDGQDAGWFLVDSGADGMMIDEKVADRLGMTALGRGVSTGADGRPRAATFRRAHSLQVGRLTYANPLLLALDLSQSSAPPGERRSGVIGYDVFARAIVEFGAGGLVTFCDPATYRLPRGGSWQDLEHLDLTPAVHTRMEGNRNALFQIDTGAAGTVDFYSQFVDSARLLDGRQTKQETTSGAGGSFDVLTGRIAWIELGGRRFDNVEASFRRTPTREGAAGVIGREITGRFVTVFDYPGHRIAFLPRPQGRPPPSGCR